MLIYLSVQIYGIVNITELLLTLSIGSPSAAAEANRTNTLTVNMVLFDRYLSVVKALLSRLSEGYALLTPWVRLTAIAAA